MLIKLSDSHVLFCCELEVLFRTPCHLLRGLQEFAGTGSSSWLSYEMQSLPISLQACMQILGLRKALKTWGMMLCVVRVGLNCTEHRCQRGPRSASF